MMSRNHLLYFSSTASLIAYLNYLYLPESPFLYLLNTSFTFFAFFLPLLFNLLVLSNFVCFVFFFSFLFGTFFSVLNDFFLLSFFHSGFFVIVTSSQTMFSVSLVAFTCYILDRRTCKAIIITYHLHIICLEVCVFLSHCWILYLFFFFEVIYNDEFNKVKFPGAYELAYLMYCLSIV